jgi:hypothetical protein
LRKAIFAHPPKLITNALLNILERRRKAKSANQRLFFAFFAGGLFASWVMITFAGITVTMAGTILINARAILIHI